VFVTEVILTHIFELTLEEAKKFLCTAVVAILASILF
jgi:hypothetical protein